MEFPVKLKARARKEGHKTDFLDTIALPGEMLKEFYENFSEEQVKKFFGAYSKFRIDYKKLKNKKVSTTMKVVEKIILRGNVTRLSKSLEKEIAEITNFQTGEKKLDKKFIVELRDIYDSGYIDEVPEQWLDGKARKEFFNKSPEKYFYEDCLIPVLEKFGTKNKKDVLPQVIFETMNNENDKRRVDFLLVHDDKKIIFEVDDETHEKEKKRDLERDKEMIKNGIKTIRVSVNELRNIERLKKKISAELLKVYKVYEKKSWVENKDFWLGVKLAHIVQVILVKAMNNGLNLANKKIVFDESVMLGIEKERAKKIIEAATEDLIELSENVAEIYGEENLFRNIQISDEGEVLATMNSRDFSGEEILVQEISYDKPFLNHKIFGDDFPRIEKVKKENLEFLLRYIFGYEEFRENQIDGVVRGLSGEDTIVLLPTGSGKSIIYQLLSFVLPGTSVIVEPLKSLMEDQVENLKMAGIDTVVNISGDINRNDKNKIFDLLKIGAYAMVYVTPERVQMEDFRILIHEAKENGCGFPMCALDEAHCVSEWGHDFRVAYLNLASTARKMLKRGNKKPIILALTGTASDSVLKDMERDLMISEDGIIQPDSFDRPEIEFRVFNVPSSEKMMRLGKILDEEIPKEFDEKNRVGLMKLQGKDTKAGVVFCVYKTGKTDFGVDSVYMKMRKSGWQEVAKYYGTETESRLMNENARKFKMNKASLMVATKAFGMGIDKENIRYTIHYGIPNSIEAYYQEAGRAGRDGKRALSYILLSNDAPERNKELIRDVLVEDLATELKKGGKKTRDDVNRLLFLHQRNYDRQTTFENLEAILTQVGGLEKSEKKIVAQNRDEFQSWQKTLFRLKVLGVIEDYVISDFPNNEMKVSVAEFDAKKIVKNYGKYVAQYQEGQAKSEMAKIKNKKYENKKDFIFKAVETLLDFSENVFENSRRRAIGNMLQLAEEGAKAKNKEEQDRIIRQKILNHLGNSYGDLLRRIVEDSTRMVEAVTAINSVMKKDEGKLLAEGRRMLQAYPNHPGLLLLVGILGSIDEETDAAVAANDVKMAMKNATEKYGISKSECEKNVILAIGGTARKNKDGEKYREFIEKVVEESSEEFMEKILAVVPEEYTLGVGARVLSRFNLMMMSEIRSKIGLDLWTKKN